MEASADTAATVLRNQFNFSERGAQTAFYPPRQRGTNTEALPIASVGGSTSQWVIYDAYVADQERLKLQDADVKGKGGGKAVKAAETPREQLDEQQAGASQDGSQQVGASLPHSPNSELLGQRMAYI